MTEVNGISLGSFLAFVAGPARHGGTTREKWEMGHQQGPAQDQPGSLQRAKREEGIEETISYPSESPAN